MKDFTKITTGFLVIRESPFEIVSFSEKEEEAIKDAKKRAISYSYEANYFVVNAKKVIDEKEKYQSS